MPKLAEALGMEKGTKFQKQFVRLQAFGGLKSSGYNRNLVNVCQPVKYIHSCVQEHIRMKMDFYKNLLKHCHF